MQTTTFTFQPKNYVPNAIVNMFEKLSDMITVTEISRPSPTRILVTTKSNRGMKQVLHRISYEMGVMEMRAFVGMKQKKFNPYTFM